MNEVASCFFHSMAPYNVTVGDRSRRQQRGKMLAVPTGDGKKPGEKETSVGLESFGESGVICWT